MSIGEGPQEKGRRRRSDEEGPREKVCRRRSEKRALIIGGKRAYPAHFGPARSGYEPKWTMPIRPIFIQVKF